jgi:hypothetical protein
VASVTSRKSLSAVVVSKLSVVYSFTFCFSCEEFHFFSFWPFNFLWFQSSLFRHASVDASSGDVPESVCH